MGHHSVRVHQAASRNVDTRLDRIELSYGEVITFPRSEFHSESNQARRAYGQD